jgi:hypothetical protein
VDATAAATRGAIGARWHKAAAFDTDVHGFALLLLVLLMLLLVLLMILLLHALMLVCGRLLVFVSKGLQLVVLLHVVLLRGWF